MTLDIIQILKNTLNYMDPRLVDHGERVAYVTYKMIQKEGIYTDKQIRDITLCALLHDIGAYKTEDIDELVVFEHQQVWAHSIYGYLFLKYFSPFKHLAPIILFHHAKCAEIQWIHPMHRALSNYIQTADRIEFIAGGKTSAQIEQVLNKSRHIRFFDKSISLALHCGISFPLTKEAIAQDEAYNAVLSGHAFSENEVMQLIYMTALSIDFRSPQTVNHTISVAELAVEIARITGNYTEARLREFRLAALLHDIGKVGIPVSVLEKPDKLTDKEFAVMKTHMVIGEAILSGSIDEEIFAIAMRHHEKLDGKGYPHGFTADELTFEQRMFTVADILSALSGVRSYKDAFSVEKISDILQDMADKRQIDKDIVHIAVTHMPMLLDKVKEKSTPILEQYTQLFAEYDDLLRTLKHIGADEFPAALHGFSKSKTMDLNFA